MEHNHKHHRDDYASSFKKRSLRSISRNRMIDKTLKLSLLVIAVLMVLIVLVAYLFG